MAGRTRGVLDIQSPHLNAFHENDVVAMEILTHQIAVAMENARLYQAVQQELTERKQTEKELQRYWLQLEELVEERTVELKATNKQLKQAQESLRLYADRLKILQEIDRAILAAQSPEDIAQAALYHLQRLVPHIQATVMEFEFDQNKLIVLASHGDDELRLGPDTSLPLTSFGLMEEFQQGWVHEVPDILTLNQSLLALQTLQSSASQSYVNIPLVARGKLIGCLNLGASQPVAFTAEHVAMAREVADQLALAIQQSRLHEQVHHYAVELEQRVAERTARLEEINTELKSFTFSVSHDLRAPLRAVQGFATALQEDYRDQLDTFGQEYLQRIMTAAERMDLLIKDLLTYSRLSRTDLQLKPVSLTAVMADVLTQLEMPLREQQAQITVKDPLPYVKGHYATLVQILVNLLTNAVKFVAPGVRPQVQIWAETRYPDEHKSEPWVRLWVEDNGIGIAPENQERIFQIFERLHGIEAYPGSGVGLAIVRKGVSRIGGHARVESNLGVGSKFWIELPRVG
jgi:signal transduction histidine kinase